MDKFIKIEYVYDKDGNESVKFTSNGFNEFEIIGLLTYYRDSIEVQAMKRSPDKDLTNNQ